MNWGTYKGRTPFTTFLCFAILGGSALTGCGGSHENGNNQQQGLSGPVDGTTQSTSGGTGSASNTAGNAIDGHGCVSKTDSNHICIGVKVVSYTQNGTPAMTQAQASTLLQSVNTIWAQCNVAFQMEEYDAVDPTQDSLSYGANSENQLTQIRQTFSNSNTFLLAVTGVWNTADIAWTELPGGGPYGTVVDAEYASHPVTVAHEFGHYQSLDHVQTNGNVMYPIVYDTDTSLTSAQCSQAVAADLQYWAAMMRH